MYFVFFMKQNLKVYIFSNFVHFLLSYKYLKLSFFVGTLIISI